MVFSQTPQWFSTHNHSQYPKELYIIGVGSSDGTAKGMEIAKRKAQADIASQIRVLIQAEMKNTTESFRLNADENIYSDFKSKAQSVLNEEILGIEIVETFLDEQTHTSYALTVLDRQKYCNTLSALLIEGWNKIAKLDSTASQFMEEGKISFAVQNLVTAKQTIFSLLPTQTLYNAVAPSLFIPPTIHTPTSLTLSIQKILSSITIEKVDGDKQKAKIGKQFPTPFTVKVLFHNDGKKIPCVNTVMVFEMGNEKHDVATDEQGIASYAPFVRPMKGKGMRVKLYFPKLEQELGTLLLFSAQYFSWKTVPPDIQFSVKSENPKLTKLISSTLTEMGYPISKKSSFLLTAITENISTKKIEGMGGTLYFINIDVIIKIINISAENEISSLRYASQGVGKSENEAIEKAIQKIKINSEELAEMLSTVE